MYVMKLIVEEKLKKQEVAAGVMLKIPHSTWERKTRSRSVNRKQISEEPEKGRHCTSHHAKAIFQIS